ncbi:hypothetical protein POTOM_031018 [Populus tomentosa]|uniref:Uncharacterized protein n=1 Tax=Populus tomentosa TaxID=118781 RepID=A0A8X7Z9W6_POPTO|nr:hypothetical protein POTOM_031018 [Populus tomentosa]
MEDKYQERPKRSGSARVPPQRGQVKAMIFKELVQKEVKALQNSFQLTKGRREMVVESLRNNSKLRCPVHNVRQCYVFTLCFKLCDHLALYSCSRSPGYKDPSLWCHALPVFLLSSSPVTFKASFLSSLIPWKHTLLIVSQIRSMDNKNGTPGEKGNASLPPRRGQIKAKIGEDLKTFITGWVGGKNDKDGGKNLIYFPENGSCSK